MSRVDHLVEDKKGKSHDKKYIGILYCGRENDSTLNRINNDLLDALDKIQQWCEESKVLLAIARDGTKHYGKVPLVMVATLLIYSLSITKQHLDEAEDEYDIDKVAHLSLIHI